MPANWSTPRTWISGETVTPVMMNRYIRNNLDFVGNPPLCKVTNELTDQSHGSSGSWVKVTFDTASLDGHGLADIANDKIVIDAAGLYQLTTSCQFAANATGYRGVQVRVNAAGSSSGGTQVAAELRENAGAGLATSTNTANAVVLEVDDELEMFAYQNSGGSLYLTGTAYAGAVAMSVLYQSTLGDDVYDDGDYDGPYITTESLDDGAVTPIKTSAGYVAKTTTYTATLDDKVIEATSGTWSLSLPTAVGNEGREYTVHNSGSGTISIDPAGAELINGSAALAVTAKGSVSICSTGAAWIVTSDVVDVDTAMGTLVQGPASATDNAVARFDGTTGKLLQSSGATLDDNGRLVVPAGATGGVSLGGTLLPSGTGSPEGAVTAPVGSIWFQTDSTVGVTHWRKATGSGNTGWVVMAGDTGWRSVSSWDTAGTVTGYTFGTGWIPRTSVAGQLALRRINNTVELRLTNVQTNASSPSASIFASLWPAGFKPSTPGSNVPVAVASASAAETWLQAIDGYLSRAPNRTIASGVVIYHLVMSWMTSDAWPASLPGSAA